MVDFIELSPGSGFCEAGLHEVPRNQIVGIVQLHDPTTTWAFCPEHENDAIKDLVALAMTTFAMGRKEVMEAVDQEYGDDPETRDLLLRYVDEHDPQADLERAETKQRLPIKVRVSAVDWDDVTTRGLEGMAALAQRSPKVAEDIVRFADGIRELSERIDVNGTGTVTRHDGDAYFAAEVMHTFNIISGSDGYFDGLSTVYVAPGSEDHREE